MHIPVLKKEILSYLNLKSNDDFIDCTAGEGGHLFSLIKQTGPSGRVLAIDKDSRNIKIIKKKAVSLGLDKRIFTEESNYTEIIDLVKKNNFYDASGIIFDLGFSNWHILESGRGFSFNKDEPLDMRYSLDQEVTARDIVNSWPPEEIEFILNSFGEERFSRRITELIISRRKKRKIETSLDLASIIQNNIPKYKKINPATKTFQALRIAVNKELESIETVLPRALSVLKDEGIIAVISFHSIEDRMVKVFFKENELQGKLKILTKKPITPDEEELKNNIKSRSSKLRIAIKKNENNYI